MQLISIHIYNSVHYQLDSGSHSVIQFLHPCSYIGSDDKIIISFGIPNMTDILDLHSPDQFSWKQWNSILKYWLEPLSYTLKIYNRRMVWFHSLDLLQGDFQNS